MNLRQRPLILFLVLCFALIPSGLQAQDETADEQLKVSLRMIGHQVLLYAGDSTSRVLPIIKIEDRFKIPLEGDFGFEPNELAKTIDSVTKVTQIANSYILEVEACESGDIVYSFKGDLEETADIVPCGGRFQPEGCYNLMFTILEPGEALIPEKEEADGLNGKLLLLLFTGFILVLTSVLVVLLRNRKRKDNPNLIQLGEYYFDKLNTELIIKEQRIELTSKEADLLLLLYDAANTTVERDVLLNKVWGDEGDYIGRTLDVFISKLRKKLEFDSKVKIVNIRGVGYKLILDV